MAKKQKSAAVITIFRSDEMTPEGRKEIVDWMRKQASHFLKHGNLYAKRFSTRYLYR